MSEIYQTIANEGPQAYQSMIFEYKVNQCPSIKEGTQCPNGVSCLGYHSTSDRRRRVFDEVTYHLRYDYHLCPILTSQSHCPDGDLCRYAHNKYEINFHPFIYKLYKCENPLCLQDPKIQSCCPGCHSTSEKAPQKIFNHAKMFLQRQDHDDLRSPAIRPHRVQLDLTTFKTEPCEIKTSHNFKECVYYHSNKKDRRRDLTKIRYYPEPCINGGPNGCDNEYCMFAHNKTEEFYHPLKFKTKYCKFLNHDINRCDYGQYCSFAHADSEIFIDLIHYKQKDTNFFMFEYKTVFCPFVYEHGRSDCVYAHNPQDYRRDPIDEPNIIPEQCEHWTRDDKIISYDMGGCPRGLKCNKCHGWKEYEFHPQIFKTRPCSAGPNCRKEACPFYHSSEDKREPFSTTPIYVDRRIGRKRVGYLPFLTPKGPGFVPSPMTKKMSQYNNNGMGGRSPMIGGQNSPPFNPAMVPTLMNPPQAGSFSSALKTIKLAQVDISPTHPQGPQSFEERKMMSPEKPPSKWKNRSEFGEAFTPSEMTGNVWNSHKSTSSFLNPELSEEGDKSRSLNENHVMGLMRTGTGEHMGGFSGGNPYVSLMKPPGFGSPDNGGVFSLMHPPGIERRATADHSKFQPRDHHIMNNPSSIHNYMTQAKSGHLGSSPLAKGLREMRSRENDQTSTTNHEPRPEFDDIHKILDDQ